MTFALTPAETTRRERFVTVPPDRLDQKAVASLVVRLPSNTNLTLGATSITFALRYDHPLAEIAHLASPRILDKVPPVWTIDLPLGEGIAQKILAVLETLDGPPVPLSALPLPPRAPKKRPRKARASPVETPAPPAQEGWPIGGTAGPATVCERCKGDEVSGCICGMTPAEAPPRAALTRVWIAEREWDRLADDVREMFSYPDVGIDELPWEGRAGAVTVEVGDSMMATLRELAKAHKVKLHEGEPPAPKPSKAKPAASVRLWIRAVEWKGLPDDSDRAALGSDCGLTWEFHGGFVTTEAPRALAKDVVRWARLVNVAVYPGEDPPRVSTGGPPVVLTPETRAECERREKEHEAPSKSRPKLHRQQPVPAADELAQRGLHVYAVEERPGEWTRVERTKSESSDAWMARAKGETGRVRVYDGKPRCTWDSLDEPTAKERSA